MREQRAIESAEPTADPLRIIFEKMRCRVITDEEAKKFDVTNEVWHSIETRLDARELINIQARGEVATGKTTVACGLAYEINMRMGTNPKLVEQLNKLIFSDQVEFIRWKDKTNGNVCIIIDEYNDMIQTGYNATTEETLFDYYSNVFAQKYVHRISCAPSHVIDRNCYLFLDVEGRDIGKKVTRCKVTYRDIVTGECAVIGHFNMFVGDIIKMPFYEKYRKKKFKRMELLEKGGIRDLRELEFAFVSLNVFYRLSKLAKIRRVTPVVIGKAVDIVRRKEGRVYSMLTVNEIVARCKGLLDLLYDKTRTVEDYKKALLLYNAAKDSKRGVLYKARMDKLKEAYDGINEVFATALYDEAKMSSIYNDYINMVV